MKPFVLTIALLFVVPCTSIAHSFQQSTSNGQTANGQESTQPAIHKRTPSMTSLEKPTPSYKESPRRISVKLGDEGVLDPAVADKELPVSTSTYDFGKYLKATVAKDDEGLESLKAEGDLFYVRKGTRVRVIDTGSAYLERVYVNLVKVRFLDGKLSGKSGWVMEECVTPDSQ